jgi:hypothetical protein
MFLASSIALERRHCLAILSGATKGDRIMKRAKLLLFSLVLLCLAAPTHAADINAASCSQADVQSAIDSAVDGDRVLVPAGSCTWTSRVLVPDTKGIIIEGAGIGNTVITDNVGTTTHTLLVDFLSGNSLARVTGFTFTMGAAKSQTVGLVTMRGWGLDAFRVDHNRFDNLQHHGVVVSAHATGNEISGVIDNNIFRKESGNVQSYYLTCAPFPPAADAGKPFSRALDLGGPDFIFFEDNTIDYSGKGSSDQTGTTEGGCRYVFRYNTIIDTTLAHHGADSGQKRGAHSFEIYKNNFDATAQSMRALHFRSGVGLAWGNTYTSTSPGNYGTIKLAVYRSCGSWSFWDGPCDGTNTWDENTTPIETFRGWRCLDQPGALFGPDRGDTPTSEPFYAWLNRDEGVLIPVGINLDPPFDCANHSLHFSEDRDWYNEKASFDGTSGVGVGVVASRPSTCTPEVGYWATDEDTFYRCTATDTWTNYYTPFTYPHPLRGESGTGASISGSVTLSGAVKVQ